MRPSIAILIACATAAAAPVPKEIAKRPDADVYVGVWDTVVSESGGMPHTKARWTFDASLKMISGPIDGGGGARSEWAIRLDPARSPKQIDIGSYQGIYEFVGADIRLVYTLSGARPTDYEAAPGKYYSLLRRVVTK